VISSAGVQDEASRSAAFSAIMNVGALIFPPTSVGRIDAPTGKALEAMHPQRGIDDRYRVMSAMSSAARSLESMR